MLYPSFIYVTRSLLLGAAQIAAGTLEAVADSSTREQFVASGSGQRVDADGQGIDLAAANYAKLAGIVLSLTGTTPITLDLTTLAAATGVQVAGASSFSNWNKMLFQNTGATPLVVSPGESNPLRNPLGGTSPTHTLASGDEALWNSNAGSAVDSTHKTITVTPTSGGQLFVAIGGS